MQQVVTTTNQIAIKALQKELDLEQLIKKEEEEREAREEKELEVEEKQEEKKKEMVQQAIKEKRLENQFNMQAQQYEEEINHIKESTNQQITSRKTQLVEILKNMRAQSKGRKNRIRQRIVGVKRELVKTVGRANRKGDQSNCSNAINSAQDMKIYCTANMEEEQIEQCQVDFCNICCTTEFGEYYDKERLICIKQVCKAVSAASPVVFTPIAPAAQTTPTNTPQLMTQTGTATQFPTQQPFITQSGTASMTLINNPLMAPNTNAFMNGQVNNPLTPSPTGNPIIAQPFNNPLMVNNIAANPSLMPQVVSNPMAPNQNTSFLSVPPGSGSTLTNPLSIPSSIPGTIPQAIPGMVNGMTQQLNSAGKWVWMANTVS
jgi:hypothetical protein